MKKIDKLLLEWEKTLLFSCIALFILFFLILFWPSEQKGSISQSASLPATPDYVSIDNGAFLSSIEYDAKVNPLNFRKQLPQETKPKQKPVVKPDPKKPADKPAQKPSQKPADKLAPKPVVKPKPPPRIVNITYRGIYKGLQGDELAFVTYSDSAKGQARNSITIKRGETIADVFTVLSFDKDQLQINEKDKKDHSLNRNASFKATIE